jgi:site-specific recombinase XerD
MSTRQLNRACHSAAADAGITKRVSLHTLRHYSACRIMPNSKFALPRNPPQL